MMPMKKLLLLFLVLLCSLTAWTAQRSPEEALSIARSFFMQSSGDEPVVLVIFSW